MPRLLTVGQLARTAGATAKAVRYYESLGLLDRAPRGPNNYRLYDHSAANRLLFIRRAKLLGLTLQETRDLLDGIQNSCPQLRREIEVLLAKKIRLCGQRINELEELQRSLEKRLVALSSEPTEVAASSPLSPECGCLPVDQKEVATTS